MKPVTLSCIANMQPHIQTLADDHFSFLFLNFPWMSDSNVLKSFLVSSLCSASCRKMIVVNINGTLWSDCVQCVEAGQHSRRNASLRKKKTAIQCFSSDKNDQERETVKACRTSHYSVCACVCVCTYALYVYIHNTCSFALIPLCLRQR